MIVARGRTLLVMPAQLDEIESFSSLGASTKCNHSIRLSEHIAVMSLGIRITAIQLMVMGNMNQAKVLSMTGLKLDGDERLLVGNPAMGKSAFGLNPAAGPVLPARIYIWSHHNKAYTRYAGGFPICGAMHWVGRAWPPRVQTPVRPEIR